ncbi:MAG: PilZ domain-containing protein [Thermoanaerobaculia bacterium]
MSFDYQSSKRDFVHVHADIPIRYKFMSKSVPVDQEGIFEGTTTNLSGSGLLLVGKLPSLSWIPALLTEDIVIGINLVLPSVEVPVKALTRVQWVEAITKGSDRCALGLRFKEISKEHQDEILKYIIKAQIAK